MSDSVLHAGHARTSHVGGLEHALQLVNHDMPLVIWTCTRRFGVSELQNLVCAVQSTNHVLVLDCEHELDITTQNLLSNPMSKWKGVIVRACPLGLNNQQAWKIHTNSTQLYDELQLLSQCTCTREHKLHFHASGGYPPRLAIRVHKALRKWVDDTTWLMNQGFTPTPEPKTVGYVTVLLPQQQLRCLC
eukprot:3496210-Amphidinium_carterae.2